jgi:hypothetical protein
MGCHYLSFSICVAGSFQIFIFLKNELFLEKDRTDATKTTGTKLPALVKYSDELGRLAITDYCKTYFCKRRAELKLNTEGDCGSYFTVTDPDNFKIKVTAPKDGGNVQFKLVFNTDYSTQNIIFFVEN